ncbi:alpha/beta hydrolase fold domain-containing protein [Inquilinus sp.]|uniref:alpha/beta hydrolase n=1 Tax=Inquilinus sp. TaxID=1932117 RepID=UPI0031D1254C
MSVSWATSSPAELRAHHARDAEERAGPLPDDVHETAVAEAGAFRGGLLFTPPDPAPDISIVYFHGGGFVAGSPATHRCVTAWLAKLTGLRVLSARYRLAPEHPFPAQRDDAAAACAAAAEMTGNKARLVLAGDSAGASVALWGLRALVPDMRARVAGLALLYGGYGGTTGESVARHGTPENGLDAETLSIMYRRLGAAAKDGGIWPLDFASEIVEPAYVLAAELDAVFDDSARLFRELGPMARDSRFVVAAGQDHGFLKGAGRDPIALRELQALTEWLRTHIPLP